ncbi:MAG: hypothetical protein LAP13_16825 [Acidobacteriia bacterium]|nr:hypothetical protein [Terriglobia bacterium]
MVNQRAQSTRCIRAASLLLCGLLGAGVWAGVGWAGQAAAQPSAKPAASASKKKARRAPAASKKPAAKAKVETTRKPGSTEIAGKRDPFKIPPAPVPGRPGEEGITGPLPPGNRGLVVGQLTLKGIVREDTSNTMIAVVTNYTRRAYFLRVNDALYNGVVSRITPDAIYFKENTLDANGRVTSHEVVKRLGPAPGEGR